jgi:DNA-binding transcriptional ArsR family regulator
MAKSVTYTLENEEQIEKIASALSSPLRRQIIRLSTESGYSIKELAAILNLPLSTISTQV